MAILRAQVVNDGQQMRALHAQWNDLAERSGASIFQTFEWQSIWWECFSQGKLIRIVNVWDGSRLVGIAPFFVERRRIGALPLARVLRFVGSYQSDYLDFICDPGHEYRFAGEVADYLAGASNWELMELGHVPEESRAIGPFLRAMEERGCQVRRTVRRMCYAIPLSLTHEEYLAHLSSRTRRELSRKRQQLFAEGFAFEIITGGMPIGEPLEDLIRLHQRRSIDTGRGVHPAAPQIAQFLRRVVGAFHELDWARLTFLRRQDRRIAGDLSFFDPRRRVAYGLRCGMDAGRWANLSPGIVLRFKVIEDAIRCGMSVYDELRGDEPYKRAFKPIERFNLGFRVTAPTAHARVWSRLEQVGRKIIRRE